MELIECEYSPQINPGSVLTAIPDTAPTLTPRSTTVLTFPFVSPTTTLTLRNPELGNQDTYQMRRIVNKTRGNTVRWLREQDWPKGVVRRMVFRGISRTLADQFRTFVYVSAGKLIGLLDYESIQWSGLITNPSEPIVEESRDCGYTFTISFEGSKV